VASSLCRRDGNKKGRLTEFWGKKGQNEEKHSMWSSKRRMTFNHSEKKKVGDQEGDG